MSKSWSPSERRAEILRILSVERQTKIVRLARYFGVTERTIYTDLEMLTSDCPFEIKRGRYGGVVVPDNWRLCNRVLAREHESVLIELMDKADDHQKSVLIGLLAAFGSPLIQAEYKEIQAKAL